MESADIVTNGLLAIIAALGGLCTWFLSRMVNKFDQLELCVEALATDLKVFKMKVAMFLNMADDMDEIPSPQNTTRK